MYKHSLLLDFEAQNDKKSTKRESVGSEQRNSVDESGLTNSYMRTESIANEKVCLFYHGKIISRQSWLKETEKDPLARVREEENIMEELSEIQV